MYSLVCGSVVPTIPTTKSSLQEGKVPMSSYLNLEIRLALTSQPDFIVSHRVHLATIEKKRLYSRTRLLYTVKRNILKLQCKIYVQILKLGWYTEKNAYAKAEL